MFEGLMERAALRAREQARRQRARIADRPAAGAPAGVRVAETADGVELSGRRLGWRLAVDRAFRTFVESVR
jgi:hypothetical protein